MTPRQADRIIAKGEAVTLRHVPTGEVDTVVITGRDRWDLFLRDWFGRTSLVDRGEMEVVNG